MSDSRAAGVSLSESLTTAMSELPESTIKALKKDINNLAGPNKKIKQDACKKYLKEYKKFANGEIESVTHPATGKSITRKDRIEFIADQCRAAFDMRLSGSRSRSRSRSKSDEDNPYKLLKLPLTFKDIDKILEYPTKTIPIKNKHLMSLFKNTNGINIEQATELLKKYLEDPGIKDTDVLLYRKIRDNIKVDFLPQYSPFMLATTFNEYIKNSYYERADYAPTSLQLTSAKAVLTKTDNLFKEA